jgi:hypothetical protein
MAETTTSFIARDQAQALLWSDDHIPDEVAAIESVEGHYSGERLFQQRPAVYRAIGYLLACGTPRTKIAEILKVHHKTVAAVAAREGGSIANQKRELAALARHGVAVAMDSVIDDLDNRSITPKDKAIILGILSDTMTKMEQGTSTYDGVIDSGSTPGHAEYEAFLAGLSGAERSALAKMGRAAEKELSKEAGATPVSGSSRPIYEADFSDDREGN